MWTTIDGATGTRPLDPALLRTALLALAGVLRGPEDRRFRIASSSSPGSFYTVTAGEGGDVTCTCPGFEYRGACRHARELKTALATGAAVPAGFRTVVESRHEQWPTGEEP